jgi:muramidase (phage lysozyme)
MDRTVPAPAALLLNFIRSIEVGTDAGAGYDVIYGHNQHRLKKPLTSMTVDEVIAAGPSWTRRWKSSAAGGYQFMNGTLKDLKSELGLRGGQVMDPDLQDRLGFHLLKRRGFDRYMAGEISRTEFGKRLAMEWASLPVLSATKGAHRDVPRGCSYYMGDELNKSLVSPEAVDAILKRVKAGGKPPQKPAGAQKPVTAPVRPLKPKPQPAPAPAASPAGKSWIVAVVAGLIAAAVAAVAAQGD